MGLKHTGCPIDVKDFLISTKVRPKRVEHLHGEGIISSELGFSRTLASIQIIVCIAHSYFTLAKFTYSEKASKVFPIFHFLLDITQSRQSISRRMDKFSWPSQNTWTLAILTLWRYLIIFGYFQFMTGSSTIMIF